MIAVQVSGEEQAAQVRADDGGLPVDVGLLVGLGQVEVLLLAKLAPPKTA